MPLARIRTLFPEHASDAAATLNAAGYVVESVRPDAVCSRPADVELWLDVPPASESAPAPAAAELLAAATPLEPPKELPDLSSRSVELLPEISGSAEAIHADRYVHGALGSQWHGLRTVLPAEAEDVERSQIADSDVLMQQTPALDIPGSDPETASFVVDEGIPVDASLTPSSPSDPVIVRKSLLDSLLGSLHSLLKSPRRERSRTRREMEWILSGVAAGLLAIGFAAGWSAARERSPIPAPPAENKISAPSSVAVQPQLASVANEMPATTAGISRRAHTQPKEPIVHRTGTAIRASHSVREREVVAQDVVIIHSPAQRTPRAKRAHNDIPRYSDLQ